MTIRIGSMFSGAGSLDRAVEQATGGTVVWHCETDPAASVVLAARWPGVPNLGDVRRINWSRVRWGISPIDILVGGFPCTDISNAGTRAGLRPGTASGLWSEMVRAIDTLRPPQVFIENVRALLTTPANRTPTISTCPGTSIGTPKPASGWCGSSSTAKSCTADFMTTSTMPTRPPTGSAPKPPCCGATSASDSHASSSDVGPGGQILDTGIGAVLGDLADLGYDAEWEALSASGAGAPHRRQRVFIVAHTRFL